jgi:FKBP12-rapamycin complex-associated protein
LINSSIIPASKANQDLAKSNIPFTGKIRHTDVPDLRNSQNKDSSTALTMSIEECFMAATSYDRNRYKAWHGWGLINHDLARNFEEKANNESEHISAQIDLEEQSLKPKSAPDALSKMRNPYLVPAIQGFFRAMALSGSRDGALQDSLRVLTLWFRYGSRVPEVCAAVADGISSVPLACWLNVIPQLIARINVPSPQIRRVLHQLLADLGQSFPQALIYPLVVAAKSQSLSRRTIATSILEKMRAYAAGLVDQALMVSEELVRVAILWEESWYEGLEEASKLYYADGNISGMLAVLEPLHRQLHSGMLVIHNLSGVPFAKSKYQEIGKSPSGRPFTINSKPGADTFGNRTPDRIDGDMNLLSRYESSRAVETLSAREKNFIETYGLELKEAWDLCLRFRRGGDVSDIAAAWDRYYQVFRRIGKALSVMRSLDLKEVSSRLSNARDLQLAIPGSWSYVPDSIRPVNLNCSSEQSLNLYTTESLWHGSFVNGEKSSPSSNLETISIVSFSRNFNVISSKQRPRKVVILGSDGRRHRFLLKGHEDLRQDERVMQLFGLVNSLLTQDNEARKRNLSIARFPIVPLSHNTGLIGWISGCDTIHSLVKLWRDSHGIPLSIEHRQMLEAAPDFERLPVVHRVEAFSEAVAPFNFGSSMRSRERLGSSAGSMYSFGSMDPDRMEKESQHQQRGAQGWQRSGPHYVAEISFFGGVGGGTYVLHALCCGDVDGGICSWSW